MLSRRNESHSKSLMGLLLFLGSYLVWLHIVKHFTGDWVYPILEILPMPLRSAFFAGCILLAVLLYFLGDYANKVIWAREIKSSLHKIK